MPSEKDLFRSAAPAFRPEREAARGWFFKGFGRDPIVAPPDVIHYVAEAVSIEEANVIAHCFRIMAPKLRVRVIETRYLTDYRIEVYESVIEGAPWKTVALPLKSAKAATFGFARNAERPSKKASIMQRSAASTRTKFPEI